MGFSQAQLIIVLIIVLIIFGPTKLPQLARSIGRSVRELKSGMSDLTSSDDKPERKTESSARPTETSDAQPVERGDSPTKNA